MRCRMSEFWVDYIRLRVSRARIFRGPRAEAGQDSALLLRRFALVIYNVFGNRLLNWPKLLGLYADGFFSISLPECVPYIIPHMFQ